MNGSLDLLLISIALANAGQIVLKIGATGAPYLVDFLNLAMISGLACYPVSMLIWVWAVSRVPLSTAYAFTALTFVLAYVTSWRLLGERITVRITIGRAFIPVGVMLVTLGERV